MRCTQQLACACVTTPSAFWSSGGYSKPDANAAGREATFQLSPTSTPKAIDTLSRPSVSSGEIRKPWSQRLALIFVTLGARCVPDWDVSEENLLICCDRTVVIQEVVEDFQDRKRDAKVKLA